MPEPTLTTLPQPLQRESTLAEAADETAVKFRVVTSGGASKLLPVASIGALPKLDNDGNFIEITLGGDTYILPAVKKVV